MAKARTSLASIIDSQFLECGICRDHINDPRVLPCHHYFCSKCLETWSESCSNDNSIVSCPLCKKVCQIPEEGVRGFPVQFLVANLQETIDKDKQNKAATSVCDIHGQETKYFCENCSRATCSDCSTLDPIHRGHSFSRLQEASKRQSNYLQTFIRRLRCVEGMYETEIQQTQKVKRDLDRATDAKTQAIDEAMNEHIQHVNKVVSAYKQNVCSKKDENMKAIEQAEKKLKGDLDSIRSTTEVARSVIESGTDSDITSLYPSLASTLQQRAQLHPTPVDYNQLSEFELDTPQSTFTDLPSLEQLISYKLNTNIAPTEHIEESDQTGSLSVTATAASAAEPLALPETECLGISSFIAAAARPLTVSAITNMPTLPTKTETPVHAATLSRLESTDGDDASQSLRFSSFRSASSAKSGAGKRWREWRKIKTTPHVKSPMGIAIHPNRDIVVSGDSSPVSVYSRNGNFNYVIRGPSSKINDISINTPYNQYIIPGGDYKNEFRIIYDSQGHLPKTIPTYDINNQASRPKSVAADSMGRIIVGLGYSNHKTVSVHEPHGTVISKFETRSSPRFVTCTPDDKLIISFDDNTLEIMDQSGHNVSVIQPPPGIRKWKPMYVCCSKQGQLFVGNQGNPKAVYRYLCTDGQYKYANCIIRMKQSPYGIALSADEQELFAVEGESIHVQIFR